MQLTWGKDRIPSGATEAKPNGGLGKVINLGWGCVCFSCLHNSQVVPPQAFFIIDLQPQRKLIIDLKGAFQAGDTLTSHIPIWGG